jgi:ABC-type uncharacterized transport system involved in gliding motility auxiliary subunit
MPLAITTLEKSQRQAQRTLVWHGVFVVVCYAVALLLRRFFRLPPQLAVTVVVVPFAVFSSDIVRWFWRSFQLNRLRAKISSR